jgi:hypothetical protein
MASSFAATLRGGGIALPRERLQFERIRGRRVVRGVAVPPRQGHRSW